MARPLHVGERHVNGLRGALTLAQRHDALFNRIDREEGPVGTDLGSAWVEHQRNQTAVGLPEEFARLIKMHEQSGRSWTACEMELLGFTHAALSADALGVWKFPEQVQIAVRDHHNPPAFDREGIVPLSAILDAANQFVNATGESIVAASTAAIKVPGPEDAAVIAALGIPEEKLGKLLSDYQAEHQAMGAFFK